MNKNILLLERRIRRLEKLVSEKSVNRGEPSNAYLVWQFLMDNGPSTSAAIKDSFPPSKRATIASVLTNALKDDCIRKQGFNLVANPDYEWDDIGISDYKQAVRSFTKAKRDNMVEVPVVEEPVEEIPKAPSVTKISGTNLVKGIIDTLKTMKAKSEFLGQINLGLNALDALDELPKKKQDMLASLFNMSFEKLRQAIIRFGVEKFTKGLLAEFKRQGIRTTSYSDPDEREDWSTYSGGDGYNNKSFDYYNNDYGMW
jgi:hypothetical protein